MRDIVEKVSEEKSVPVSDSYHPDDFECIAPMLPSRSD